LPDLGSLQVARRTCYGSGTFRRTFDPTCLDHNTFAIQSYTLFTLDTCRHGRSIWRYRLLALGTNSLVFSRGDTRLSARTSCGFARRDHLPESYLLNDILLRSPPGEKHMARAHGKTSEFCCGRERLFYEYAQNFAPGRPLHFQERSAEIKPE
jgi:hypothetical protein